MLAGEGNRMAMSAACLSPQPPIMDGQKLAARTWLVHTTGLARAVCRLCTAAQSVTLGETSLEFSGATSQSKTNLPVSRGRPVNKLASVDLASLTVEHIAPVNTWPPNT